jgi:hypothetical protein
MPGGRPETGRDEQGPELAPGVEKVKVAVCHQLAYWRRSSSQAWRVRPLYPARNPAKASRSAVLNTGATGTRAADGDVVTTGHLRGEAEARRLGAARPRQMMRTSP